MEDLIRANALLINEDGADTEDIPEIEDEDGAGNIDEEEEVVDVETDSWQ